MNGMLSKQEIFNKVRDHLLVQDGPSVGPKGQCMYRGVDGSMCAVGCLLKDDPIIEEMEGKTITEIFYPWFRRFFLENGIDLEDKDTLYFLEDLQGAHDDAAILSVREGLPWHPIVQDNLAKVATAHDLEM